MLLDAAQRLPNNLLVVSNASISLLVDVLMNGMDTEKIKSANEFRHIVLKNNMQHPKLPEIAALMAKIKVKYSLEG